LDRHRVDADPDATFEKHFDAGPDPEPPLVLDMLENQTFLYLFLFTAPAYIVFIFLFSVTDVIIFNVMDSRLKFSEKSIV
jgi:hypothetical protein